MDLQQDLHKFFASLPTSLSVTYHSYVECEEAIAKLVLEKARRTLFHYLALLCYHQLRL